MDKFTLKVCLGQMIVESNIDKPSKQILLQWLQTENDQHQLMSFALDSELIKLDEMSKKIVQDRFDNSEIKSLFESYVSEIPSPTALAAKVRIMNQAAKANLSKGTVYKSKLGKAKKAGATQNASNKLRAKKAYTKALQKTQKKAKPNLKLI